jgi:NAD(P)-dependent dehydrogenase (short-subunit alcohol dehydrogenase family)
MAAAGITVIVADFDHGAAEKVRGAITSAGGKADALSVDVTQAREVKAVVTDVEKRFGRIDVLANIAGGSFYTKRIEEFTWAEWKEVIDVNLKGTFLMCREVAPLMQKQKSGAFSTRHPITASRSAQAHRMPPPKRVVALQKLSRRSLPRTVFWLTQSRQVRRIRRESWAKNLPRLANSVGRKFRWAEPDSPKTSPKPSTF